MSRPDLEPDPNRFEPKTKIELDPPRNDIFTPESLLKFDGTGPESKAYVGIKGTVFDVSKNALYAPGGKYHVFTGKDSSRALASTSVEPEDCRPDWQDLPDEKIKVLNEWYLFFSKRYNVMGKVQS